MFVCYRMVQRWSNLAVERRREEGVGQNWRWQKSDPPRLSSQGQELLGRCHPFWLHKVPLKVQIQIQIQIQIQMEVAKE